MGEPMISKENALSRSAAKVQAALNENGLQLTVRELAKSTRTAEDAARAVDCRVGQIVKSLIVRGEVSGRAYLVLVSGPNRLNLKRLAGIVDEPVAMAPAEFVRSVAGFAIGGVPPLGHPSPLLTYIDRDLLDYPQVWAAAGTPRALFTLTPDQLVQVTGGEVVDINQG